MDKMDEIIEVRRKQLRRRLSLSFIIGAAVATVVALCFVWLAYHPTQWGFGAIAIIGLGSSVTAGAFLTALVTAIKLGVKPSWGGRSPSHALKKFYSNVLVSRGTIYSKVQAEAMLVLHRSAITSIDGWKGFETYWTGVNNQIFGELTGVCKNYPTGTSVEVRSVKQVATPPGKQRFLVTIAFQTKYEKQTMVGGSDTFTEGPWIYTAENEVVMEDRRWYLASAEWAGRPQVS